MTSAQLADELEVARRTILRDVDAMTEAGLPIIVHGGNTGGIELGFNYRTRLTGLASDEAEAMAVILTHPISELDELGMQSAADRARNKLLESFPDGVREKIQCASKRFRFDVPVLTSKDSRVEALAGAIRGSRIVRINARSWQPRTIWPLALVFEGEGWMVTDGRDGSTIPIKECGDINISSRSFSTENINR